MPEQDMPNPIEPLARARSLPARVLLDWAMETCGVEEAAELLRYLDDQTHAREAAIGVFWHCQDILDSMSLEISGAVLLMNAILREDIADDGDRVKALVELIEATRAEGAAPAPSAPSQSQIVSRLESNCPQEVVADLLRLAKGLTSSVQEMSGRRQALQAQLRDACSAATTRQLSKPSLIHRSGCCWLPACSHSWLKGPNAPQMQRGRSPIQRTCLRPS